MPHTYMSHRYCGIYYIDVCLEKIRGPGDTYGGVVWTGV